jgi:hypothetical protein
MEDISIYRQILQFFSNHYIKIRPLSDTDRVSQISQQKGTLER